MFRSLIIFWLSVVFVVFVLNFFVASAEAQSTDEAEWLRQKVETEVSKSKNGCIGTWRVLWPEAKKGNEDARAMLAGAVFFLGLNPAGQGRDAVTRLRNRFIWAVYGLSLRDDFALLPESDKGSLKLSFELYMKSKLTIQPLGRKFLACLRKSKNPRVCTNKFVEKGFIPSFEDYAKEIDILAGSEAKAECMNSLELR